MDDLDDAGDLTDLSLAPAPWFFPFLNLYLVPSSGDVERARALKEEGNELVKKGNHKKAIEKYSESLSYSNLESATYSNRYLPHSCWPGISGHWIFRSVIFSWTAVGSPSLAFSQYVTAQNMHSLSCDMIVSGIHSLTGIETEECPRGTWALLTSLPRIFIYVVLLYRHNLNTSLAAFPPTLIQNHGFSKTLILETLALRAQGRTQDME